MTDLLALMVGGVEVELAHLPLSQFACHISGIQWQYQDYVLRNSYKTW